MLSLVAQYPIASKIEDQSHGQLIYGLSDNHLPHVQCDQTRRSWIRFSIKNRWSRWVRGQGESGECVHDKVNPEQLNRGEDGFFVMVGYCGHKRKAHCSDINGKLELDKGPDESAKKGMQSRTT